jgi:hypothetical protein
MTEPARHLRVIDSDGVELDGCPSCARKADEIEGLQRDIRGWAARYGELKRDKEADAERSRYWPAAVEVFEYWQRVCKHPRSAWSAERFFLVEPFLKKHGIEMCKRAVDGAAFDPFVTTRRNGSTKRHDSFDLVFRAPDKFEEFCNRAPRRPADA